MVNMIIERNIEENNYLFTEEDKYIKVHMKMKSDARDHCEW